MEITIAKRFCGPPESGNGGYSCGRLAAFAGNPAEITLRAPPPLGTPLTVQRESGAVRLLHGEQLIAEGRSATLELDVPAPPRWDEAVKASKRYNGLRNHAYDTCFVCGPRRGPGDGLCIHCGPWHGGKVAGTWIPDASIANRDGGISPVFVWAAIDCPGSWSVIGRDDADAPVRELPSTLLLGRLTGRVLRSPRLGEPCTVLGWFLGSEGRKYHVGTAIHAGGELIAYSKGTWIAQKT